MPRVIYKFADGSTQSVNVDKELYAVIRDIERQERRGWKRSNERCLSLEGLAENGNEPDDGGEMIDNILGNLMK